MTTPTTISDEHANTLLELIHFRREWLSDYGERDYKPADLAAIYRRLDDVENALSAPPAALAGEAAPPPAQHSGRVNISPPAEPDPSQEIVIELDGTDPPSLLEGGLPPLLFIRTDDTAPYAVTLRGPRRVVHDFAVKHWDDEETISKQTGMTPIHLRTALLEAADACETLCDLDDGENTDYHRLQRVAAIVREHERTMTT